MMTEITTRLAVAIVVWGILAPGSAAQELRIENFRCYSESGYQHIVGSVTNISDGRLRNVMAVGVFKDSSGQLIKRADALIDYDPLLPGQTSPFEALTLGHPYIERCGLAFRTFAGRQIPAVTYENSEEGRRDLVRRLQERLNALGYVAGPEDGLLGPKTRDAIARYKEDQGLDVDREIDTELKEALGITSGGRLQSILDDVQRLRDD
jgi:hypothetical protein